MYPIPLLLFLLPFKIKLFLTHNFPLLFFIGFFINLSIYFLANLPNFFAASEAFRNFELSQYLPLTTNMQLIVETADWDAFGGHLLEAGFDKFQISSSVPTDINNVVVQENRKLVQIVDILGREVKDSKNIVLFYIYDDGSVEKKVTIE